MKKYDAVSIGKVGFLYLLILVCLGFLGCASANKIISEDKRIPLVEKGSDSGVFKDTRLTIEYSYSLAGDKITMTGNGHFSGRIDSLSIYLLFLDAAGKRIDKKLVAYSGFRSMDMKSDHAIDKTLVVPSGATGVSFSYYSQERMGRD
jgi:hypothetical protein